ncbi:MAG TPA: hypothetical protein PKI14_10485 [Fervidobacterium sp.]|jgi:hypothetical protein|nr:hypothetical protein [Bacillota bacterium]NLU55038.1 hypothetical protein [Bacillota bacterium]HPT62279.1 hypothetical protein [Bacillota bacterium]HUM43363.1 hypothetical protein [Fervidobacterium sp.]
MRTSEGVLPITAWLWREPREFAKTLQNDDVSEFVEEVCKLVIEVK